MSQNKNYSKFSQKKENVNLEEIFPETEAVEADAEQEPIMDPVVEEEAEQAQEIVEESQKVEESVQTVGFVDNCECLRVRKESNVDSEELCIINKLSEVVIDVIVVISESSLDSRIDLNSGSNRTEIHV